jgi:GxxExxY protein
MIELSKTGLKAENQKPITVYYDDELIVEFVANIIVNDEIIVE